MIIYTRDHHDAARAGQTAYAGCVLSITGAEYRGGSQYAFAWDAATHSVVSVTLQVLCEAHWDSGQPDTLVVWATAVVDATPEVCALAATYHEQQAVAREGAAQGRRHAELLDVEAPKRGQQVIVARGRKVPQGTRGTLRWVGDGAYGTRAGIAVEGQEKLVYTALSNLNVLDHRIPVLVSHPQRQTPALGTRVTTKAGVTGKVFWAQGERLGVKIGPSRGDVVWCNVRDLAA